MSPNLEAGAQAHINLTVQRVFRGPSYAAPPPGSGRGALALEFVVLALLGLMFVLGLGASPDAQANELQKYAEACTADVGVAVTGFNCMDGTELPMVGTEGDTCEKPPYLDAAGCHKGSRIGQQATADKFGVVYLCRKKESGLDTNKFDDIAVIETNFETGATCFFQKFGDAVDGRAIPPPSTGTFWMTPTEMRHNDNACVQCHDSGAFIRTPYVMQAGLEALKNVHRNKTHYWFGGDAYVRWNGLAYQVRVDGDKNCSNACHVMGANTSDPTRGTSAYFGLRSTGAVPTEFLKDPVTGTDVAHWMKPAQRDKEPSPVDQSASQQYAACANAHGAEGCTVTLWGGQVEAIRRMRGHYPDLLERAISSAPTAPPKTTSPK